MSRTWSERAALLAIALWAWLAMMLTHELGHVLAAWATGGAIVSVELRPGWLSHTLVRPNPAPSTVLWGGFLCGWLAPLLSAPWWRIERGLIGPALRAWTAFCWLAGGVYLAIGGGERLTDTGQLLLAGWPHWLLVVVGVVVAAVGFAASRRAWTAIDKRLEAEPLGWRATAGWWLWLAVWIAGQGAAHGLLNGSLGQG
ncbi:hypothetical protein [Botrimarina sp.]|uniref:hypothetical protein n=1 Tax=Botrimarina sp. TaxID=2795802 RepID=UPI0032ECB9B6